MLSSPATGAVRPDRVAPKHTSWASEIEHSVWREIVIAQAARMMVGKVTCLWAVAGKSRSNWHEEDAREVEPDGGDGGKSDMVDPARFDLQKSFDAS